MSVAAPALPKKADDRRDLQTPRVGECVLLNGIRWSTYDAILRDLGDHTPLRLTYDRGRLQIMSPLPIHERLSQLLGQMVRVLAAFSQLSYSSLGSMTIRREDLESGLEADNCFYLINATRILGKRDLDFRIDPPPDLAIEVDITSSSLDRFAIYASLRVPEIWRCDETTLRCYHLNAAGIYEERTHSRAFPFLRVGDLVPFLSEVINETESALTQRFQDWLRTHGPAGAASI